MNHLHRLFNIKDPVSKSILLLIVVCMDLNGSTYTAAGGVSRFFFQYSGYNYFLEKPLPTFMTYI